MRLSLSALVLLTTLMLGASLRAEVMVANSLEWLCASCPQVERARLAGLHRASPETRASLRFTRVESFKGNPPETTEWATFVSPGAIGDEFLVFLKDGQVVTAINLTKPPTRGEAAAYTADFKLLSDSKTLLAQVRQSVQRTATESRRAEVPVGSPAHEALYSGSTCFLIVPK